MKELDELKDLLNKQLESCRPMQDSLKKIMALHSWYYCQLQKDPMFCFWNSNRYFMPLAEKELLFTKWLRYFDEHKDEMEARVVKVRQSTEYISCLQRSQNGKYDLGQLPDKPVRSVASQTLGTYNIAEVVKLLDTVIVYASYTDMDGNNLEPVIIYLTDKTVNTVIRYDGTDKYSPYKFRLSPTTVKAMIAIDKQGSAYLCSPEHLRGIHVNGHQLTHTFILKKIQKIKGKQELLKLLEHDGSYPELTVQPAPKEK